MDVALIALLANLTLTQAEAGLFSSQFTDTLKTVNLMNEVSTEGVSPVHQVTGLSNVTRPDVIDSQRIVSQSQALSQARQTNQGYFVVPSVFDAV